MAYGQKNYHEKQGVNGIYEIAEIGCLLTFFSNLLLEFGTDIPPNQLAKMVTERNIWIDVDDGIRDDLGWESVTALFPSVIVLTTGTSGWPQSNNAAVKFRYQSKQNPFITVNGKRVPNMITHFAKVSNFHSKTIVDSWDGLIKQNPYGEPIGWAIYGHITPQVVVPPVVHATPEQAPAGRTYTVRAGDSLSLIAMKHGTTYQTLAQLNGIQNPSLIRPGQIIRLPEHSGETPTAVPGITYEMLKEPQKMHVSHPGGAHKWAFGKATAYQQMSSNGVTPEKTNVDIYAVAKVPVSGEYAGYYMDRIATGDMATTGHPAFTIGYNHKDLSPGYYDATPKPEVPTPIPANGIEIFIQTGWGLSHAMQAAGWPREEFVRAERWAQVAKMNGSEDWAAFNNSLKTGMKIWVPRFIPPPPFTAATPNGPVAAPAPVPEPKIEEAKPDPNAYKSTIQRFIEPERYISKESFVVQEMDERQNARQVFAKTAILMDGTFTKDGITYLRPAKAAEAGFWFGVPEDKMESEEVLFEELYNKPTDPEKSEATLMQNFWIALAHLRIAFKDFTSKISKNKG